MGSRKNGFLSKVFTILLVPSVMGGAVYLIFEAFQSAYTSEAQIQVNEALWLDPYKDSTRLINEYTLNRRVQEVVGQISADAPLTLLAYRLALHDLGKDPFSKHRFLEEYDGPIRSKWSGLLQKRLQSLETDLLDSDEGRELHAIIHGMGYLPQKLRSYLGATQIPGTSLIQVQANGKSPEMSGFIVNAFCEEFIRFVSHEERERLEDMLRVVNKHYEKKQKELQGNMENMDERQDVGTEEIDPQLWELKRRIKRLENTRVEEQKRFDELEKELEKTSGVKVQHSPGTKVQKALESQQLQMEESRKRLEAIDKQLNLLKEKVENRETNILKPIQVSVDSLRESMASIEKDKEKIQLALNYTDKLLIQVIKGKTRHPSPYTSLFLALQTGFAALLLWLIFLHQMNFVSLFKTASKKNNGAIFDMEGET